MDFNYFAFYWNIATLLAVWLYGKHLFKIFHWSFVTASIYTVVNSLWAIQYVTLYEPFAAKTNVTLVLHHYEALATFIFAVFIMEKVKPKEVWFAWICFVNVVLTIWLLPLNLTGDWVSGLTVNPSMNLCIIAITFPFIGLLPKFWMRLLSVVGGLGLMAYSYVLHSTSTPILAVIVALIVFFFFHSREGRGVAGFLLVLTCVPVLLVQKLLSPGDRLMQWKIFFNYWRENINWLFGAGNGSFYVLGPVLQQINGGVTDYFVWMHSDVLQTLFELGFVGFVLWGIAIGYVFYRLRKKILWLAAGVAWLVTAAAYYPLHFPIQLWLGMMVATVAIKKESGKINDILLPQVL